MSNLHYAQEIRDFVYLIVGTVAVLAVLIGLGVAARILWIAVTFGWRLI